MAKRGQKWPKLNKALLKLLHLTKQVKRILVNNHSTGVKLEAQKSRDWDEEHYFTLVMAAWFLVTNLCRARLHGRVSVWVRAGGRHAHISCYLTELRLSRGPGTYSAAHHTSALCAIKMHVYFRGCSHITSAHFRVLKHPWWCEHPLISWSYILSHFRRLLMILKKFS